MEYSQNKRIIIAIDGFSSCGKSTFAREIASRIGYIFIDTGAMYRTVTLYALQQGMIAEGELDEHRLIASLDNINITFLFNPQRGASDIFLNGDNVEQRIRMIDVSSSVSRVSGIVQVRSKLVALQQAMGMERGIVMDGRDIGTVVFPDAELKIFMTAEVGVRARRRYDELTSKGQDVTLSEIEQNIAQRDHDDQARSVSPLRQADDAIVLDNSYISISQQMDWVMKLIEKLTC